MERANGFDQFYSRMTANDKIELFVDHNGRPTISRPHVHVIHHGNGCVEVVATTSEGRHPWRTSLQNPSGNEVNRAIADAGRHII